MGQPDPPVVERGALEDHVGAGRDADDRKREDREPGDLGPLVPHPDHAFRVGHREHEEGDGDEDPERQVQEKHRVEEGRVPGEAEEIDRVGRDQSEGDQEKAVETPLPGAQHARRFPGRGGGLAHEADSTRGEEFFGPEETLEQAAEKWMWASCLTFGRRTAAAESRNAAAHPFSAAATGADLLRGELAGPRRSSWRWTVSAGGRWALPRRP